MPRRRGYSGRRRLVGKTPSTALAMFNPSTGLSNKKVYHPKLGKMVRLRMGNQGLSQLASPMRLVSHANELAMAYDTINNWHKMAGMLKSKQNVKTLKQTTASLRGNQNMNRHDQLKSENVSSLVPKGKGKGFSKANGRLTTHGKGKVPRWKLKRLGKYKHNVYQTVLISRSNRLPASQNLLERSRYPIYAPECLDGERIQSMVFSPFCSHFSGIHSTRFQKVQSDGTDLDHSSQLLDVIQNRADIARHNLPSNVDGVGGSAIVYESDFAGGAITAGTARGASNLSQIHTYYDQLVKGVNVNLVFTPARVYDMRVSVSVVRFVKTSAPNTLSANDKKMLLNNLDYKGIEYNDYRVEWNHIFTLKGLKKDKNPSRYSVNKKIKCNFLQSNTFESNNTAEAMIQSGATQLGKDINVRQNETTDGDVSSQFFVIIKYKKV